LKNYEIKQNKYKKSIEVLHELIERKKDQKNLMNEKGLAALEIIRNFNKKVFKSYERKRVGSFRDHKKL
jgi:hypothetical protein